MGGIGIPELVILLIVLGIEALLLGGTYLLAKRKNRSTGWWLVSTVLFGPLALLVLLLMPKREVLVSPLGK